MVNTTVMASVATHDPSAKTSGHRADYGDKSNGHSSQNTPPVGGDLESEISALGQRIFNSIGREQPSAFSKNYWSSLVMAWSMRRPSFKINSFRLVDVLPTLRSNQSIADHVREYLESDLRDMHPALAWALRLGTLAPFAPITAAIVRFAVNQMAQQFIAGNSPDEALPALKRLRRNGLAFTVDLLGEFSVSEPEALEYLRRYEDALSVLGTELPSSDVGAALIEEHPGELSSVCVSVKLSALYSQCHFMNFEQSVDVLSERLAYLTERAGKARALLYVDAEDSANNPIIYAAFKNVFGSSRFKDFPYPGIVVQAYAKGARAIVEDLLAFAGKRGAPIAIRLVKGAYWDYETIISQQNNWESPLFSKKESSDANYELLSRILLDNAAVCLPAFGSHNVRSLAHAVAYARSIGLGPKQFELQMLYGMAEPIAHAFSAEGHLVRLYVPLGEMLPGMGYLVRRLLENTSNESFLRHTFVEGDKIDALLKRPLLRE